jgi:hypothetical protein
MAITIMADGYHEPTVQALAEPFGDAEVERHAAFNAWRQKEESKQRMNWYLAKAPLAESKELSFAFDESLMPTKYRLSRGDRHWDYAQHVGIGGSHAVSQRFKDAIESVEPGIHQFIPFELWNQSGELIVDPFYFWRIRTSLDAISPELDGVKPSRNSPNHQWNILPGDGREKLAVLKASIDGRAAWCDVRMPVRRFLSDEAVTALKEHGVVGWTSDYYWKEL